MQCIINGKEYKYVTDVKNNDTIRHSFCELSKNVFGLDFEPWYQGGYWGDLYIPHALMDNNTVVSNVSVNILDMQVNNQQKRFIQIGTVMTEPLYRSQGLSRWIMDSVLSVWKDKCDGIFLFANSSVLEFYPKFGFESVSECQFQKHIDQNQCGFRKLDMNVPDDKKLLLNHYRYSNPYSALTMENNEGLLMFYCSQFMKDNIYYIEEYDTVIVAEQDGERLLCYDIFSDKPHELDYILGGLINSNKKKTILGFTPKTVSDWNISEIQEDDTTLFLLSGKYNPFKIKKMMFPLLSHA